jgi:transcriptional regulator of acetoin/glycerol metabolism
MPDLIRRRAIAHSAGLLRGEQSPFDGEVIVMHLPTTRDELIAVLADCGGSPKAAALHFGVNRRTVHRWMQKWAIKRSTYA